MNLQLIDSPQSIDSQCAFMVANLKHGEDVIIGQSLQDPELIKQRVPKG